MFRLLLVLAMAAAAIGFASPASALELQIGTSYVELSKSDEHDAVSTGFPAIALGFSLSDAALLFIEAGVLQYQVEKSGDRGSKATSQGTIDVNGTSYALILARRTSVADFRIGYGLVEYTYKNKLGSGTREALELFGVTNYKEDLEPATGTQAILGIDFNFTDWLHAGIEYRSVSVRPKSKGGGDISGSHFSFSDSADLSHSWLAYRLALVF